MASVNRQRNRNGRGPIRREDTVSVWYRPDRGHRRWTPGTPLPRPGAGAMVWPMALSATAPARSLPLGERVGAYVALTKPRIIELLLITTLPTMVVAQRGLPPVWLMAATLLGGALAAGGANAINMFVDRDIDKVMHRTSKRPLVTGAVTPRNALIFAITLEVVAFVELWALGQPAVGVPGRVGHPLLRLRLHAVAEADQQPEHRHRRRGRRGPGAGRMGGGHRQPGLDARRAVRHHLRVDAAPLLGAGRQVQGRLPGGQRAHAAGGGHLQADGPGDPRLQRAAGRCLVAAGRGGQARCRLHRVGRRCSG